MFFLNSPETPPVSVETTFLRRSLTRAKSTLRPVTSMPKSAASSISDRMSATRSTAFAGMQATLRQRPPITPFSTTAVFIESCAALIAAT